MSFDVEAAFLNGIALARELYCWPPNDVKKINPKRLWRLKKGVFGLGPATSQQVAANPQPPKSGFLRQVKAAAATFILKDTRGKLCGVLVLHVDDGLCCGYDSYYEGSLKELQKRAPLNVFKKRLCGLQDAR